mmetsp:Transcript_101276/g.261724  ORF Transcript_101276/g.261724 Transcript_101276/m.261724 type:complete len:479 (-) Transcript_101276:895-2331(-)
MVRPLAVGPLRAREEGREGFPVVDVHDAIDQGDESVRPLQRLSEQLQDLRQLARRQDEVVRHRTKHLDLPRRAAGRLAQGRQHAREGLVVEHGGARRRSLAAAVVELQGAIAGQVQLPDAAVQLQACKAHVADAGVVAPLGDVLAPQLPRHAGLPAVEEQERLGHAALHQVFQVQPVVPAGALGAEARERAAVAEDAHALAQRRQVLQRQEPLGPGSAGQAGHEPCDDRAGDGPAVVAQERHELVADAEVLRQSIEQRHLLGMVQAVPLQGERDRLAEAQLRPRRLAVPRQGRPEVPRADLLAEARQHPLEVEGDAHDARAGVARHRHLPEAAGVLRRRVRESTFGVGRVHERALRLQPQALAPAVERAEEGAVVRPRHVKVESASGAGGVVQVADHSRVWRIGADALVAGEAQLRAALAFLRDQPQETAQALHTDGVVGDIQLLHLVHVQQRVFQDEGALEVDAVHRDVQVLELVIA